MRRSDFMRMVNSSFPSGGLTCSFQDHQLSQYIQIKRRASKHIPTKRAVSLVGPQNNHVWVLGPDVHISSDGDYINADDSEYIWISDLYTGPGVADNASVCNINLPLNVESLEPLIHQLKLIMRHNFFPALMLMGSSVMALHYNTVKSKFGFCPVPVAFGHPGTGKTTALKCCLGMMGLLPQRLWSSGTKQMFTQILCNGYMPLGIDDPNSQIAISELVMSLFGGANEGTVTRGTYKPTSMAVISANFTVKDSEKYVCLLKKNFKISCVFRYLSRCVLIEFVHPRIDSTISEFDKLHQLIESSSSAVGFLISLGNEFLINSTKDLDEQVLPKLKSALEDAVIPRIYIGYAILIWFVLKVIITSPILICCLCKHCL